MSLESPRCDPLDGLDDAAAQHSSLGSARPRLGRGNRIRTTTATAAAAATADGGPVQSQVAATGRVVSIKKLSLLLSRGIRDFGHPLVY